MNKKWIIIITTTIAIIVFCCVCNGIYPIYKHLRMVGALGSKFPPKMETVVSKYDNFSIDKPADWILYEPTANYNGDKELIVIMNVPVHSTLTGKIYKKTGITNNLSEMEAWNESKVNAINDESIINIENGIFIDYATYFL